MVKSKSVFYGLWATSLIGIYGLPTLYLCRNPKMPLGRAIKNGFKSVCGDAKLNQHLGVSGMVNMLTGFLAWSMYGVILLDSSIGILEGFEEIRDIAILVYSLLLFIVLPFLIYKKMDAEYETYLEHGTEYLGYRPPAQKEYN